MSGLPIVLDVEGRTCVVVGGGRAGSRKIKSLLAANANVIVIDPADLLLSDPALIGVEHRRRNWAEGDSEGATLTVTATDSPYVNQAAANDASHHGALVLRADLPDSGGVRLPAVHRVGQVTVAVDTSGASPTLAAWFRDQIAAITEGWDELATWAADNRPVTPNQIAERDRELRAHAPTDTTEGSKR